MVLVDKGFEIETLAASSYKGAKVGTFRFRYPRIILSELNTHRGLSKNSSSSRAIPIAKMLESIQNDPAMPVRFGGNKPGMQDDGTELRSDIQVPVTLSAAFREWTNTYGANWEVGDWKIDRVDRQFIATSRCLWRFMAWLNSQASAAYAEAGYHKQIANRLTEPYQWMNTVISGTTEMWEHFLGLRHHPAADPTIAKLAEMFSLQWQATEFKELRAGEWHLPYIKTPDNFLSWGIKLDCPRPGARAYPMSPSMATLVTRKNSLGMTYL